MSFMSSIIHTEEPTTLPYISGVPEWQKFGGENSKRNYFKKEGFVSITHLLGVIVYSVDSIKSTVLLKVLLQKNISL